MVRAWGAKALAVDLFDSASVRGALDDQEAICNLATHIPSLSKATLPGAWKENDRLRRQVSANLVTGGLDVGSERYVQESVGFLYPDKGDEWIVEQIEPAPTPITESALEAEANTARFSQAGRTGVVLRFAQFYGLPCSHSLELVSLARRFGIGPLPGEPDGYSSWIHNDDLGPAVLAALAAPAGTYNVGDDEPIRRRDLHALIALSLGRTRQLEIGKLAARLGGRKAGAVARSQRLSNAAFKSATRWAPKVRSASVGWPALIAELDGAR
jgi:nucleoside-diphosphate-sugar epimerase